MSSSWITVRSNIKSFVEHLDSMTAALERYTPSTCDPKVGSLLNYESVLRWWDTTTTYLTQQSGPAREAMGQQLQKLVEAHPVLSIPTLLQPMLREKPSAFSFFTASREKSGDGVVSVKNETLKM